MIHVQDTTSSERAAPLASAYIGAPGLATMTPDKLRRSAPCGYQKLVSETVDSFLDTAELTRVFDCQAAAVQQTIDSWSTGQTAGVSLELGVLGREGFALWRPIQV